MTTTKTGETPDRLGYTVNEFADAARISRPTVYRMIRDAQLKTVQVRGRQIVPVAEAKRIFAGEPV